jgi:hypothetical protein
MTLLIVTMCLEIVPICYRFAQGAKVSTLSTTVTSNFFKDQSNIVTWCLWIVLNCCQIAQGAKASALSTAVTSKDNTVRNNQIPNNSYIVSRDCS